MLSEIIEKTNLDEAFCASLVGASQEQFGEWTSGKRALPNFLVPELSSVLGVSPARLRGDSISDSVAQPAIWFKLRNDKKCNLSDLEMIGMVRKLCFRVGQFLDLQGKSSESFRQIFERAREAVRGESTAKQQGKSAASVIRAEFGWDHGSSGIGEFIRPNLQKYGLVVVESAFRDALVQGCTFLTSGPESQLTCLFVNTYQMSWWLRNAVLLHELCHAIFDLQADGVSVDYQGANEEDATELRAQSFAQECLLPKRVLLHFQNQYGLIWKSLTPKELAQLIAGCHATQSLILRAALDYGLIEDSDFIRYSGFECAALLDGLTSHGLSTREYANTRSPEERKWLHAKRFVEFGNRKLLLPAKYVQGVIEALNDGKITPGKAAELTLMDKYDFKSRFAYFLKSE